MKATTIKAIAAILTVGFIAGVHFVWGCEQGDVWSMLVAVIVLAGKEVGELRMIKNGQE